MRIGWWVAVVFSILLGGCVTGGEVAPPAPAPAAEPAALEQREPELDEKDWKIRLLEMRVWQLERNLARALEALDDNDIGYVYHRKSGELEILPPRIAASVVSVDAERNVVVLSAGRKDGVEIGYQFTIYRGDRYVAKFVVEEVAEDTCTGYSPKELQNGAIEKGDSARTRW